MHWHYIALLKLTSGPHILLATYDRLRVEGAGYFGDAMVLFWTAI